MTAYKKILNINPEISAGSTPYLNKNSNTYLSVIIMVCFINLERKFL